MSDEYDYIFKIIMIGNTGVGKSSILFRFTENSWDNNFIPTIGVDLVSSKLIILIIIENKNNSSRSEKGKAPNMGYCRSRKV